MQKSMLKNSVFNIIYTASNILFPFITSIYVSRILLPVGVGKVASAQNIASYGQRISNSLPRCSSFSCRTFLDGKSSGCFAIW